MSRTLMVVKHTYLSIDNSAASHAWMKFIVILDVSLRHIHNSYSDKSVNNMNGNGIQYWCS